MEYKYHGRTLYVRTPTEEGAVCLEFAVYRRGGGLDNYECLQAVETATEFIGIVRDAMQ